MALSKTGATRKEDVHDAARAAVHRLLALGAALAACAADGEGEQSARRCGDLAFMELAGCDPSTLATLERGGLWNHRIRWDGGGGWPGVFDLAPGRERINGPPASARIITEGAWYLATEHRRGAQTFLYAYAGCQAAGPRRFTGRVQQCSDGRPGVAGNFEAVRLARRDGKPEASGVRLVSETALPKGVALDVFVAGSRAFVPALSGLAVYDLRDRERPVLLAWIDAGEDL